MKAELEAAAAGRQILLIPRENSADMDFMIENEVAPIIRDHGHGGRVLHAAAEVIIDAVIVDTHLPDRTHSTESGSGTSGMEPRSGLHRTLPLAVT
jgi:hypothetical protein